MFQHIQPRSGEITVKPEPGLFAVRCREYQTPHDYPSPGAAQRAINTIEANAAAGVYMACREPVHQVIDHEHEVVLDSNS